VVVGMTGSGKTGLVTVLIEEALQSRIPVLVIDVKGDLPNLLLKFPTHDSQHLVPWVESSMTPEDGRTAEQLAEELALGRKQSLEAWQVPQETLRSYCESTQMRVITPGSSAGELLHVLSSLERRSERWDSDVESARAALSAAVSLLLRLIGKDPDPAKSKEHAFLSLLAEQRLRNKEPSDLTSLIHDITEPPIERIGPLLLNDFLSKNERRTLAAAISTLLVSSTFASWREGATLDIGDWLTPRDGKTPATIVSVAHLDDDERALVLGVVLEEVLSWVRSLKGTQRLRALVVFDEVYGFLPPHPANPPTKRPMVALMKQARAFGVGVVVATQNPMDLDYRALSNAGIWCVGRLQTDADRERVVEALASSASAGAQSRAELEEILKRLAPRWFLTRDAHAGRSAALLQPRCAMTLMRGPMTRSEIKEARKLGAAAGASYPTAVSSPLLTSPTGEG
jgi:hypothetical protein